MPTLEATIGMSIGFLDQETGMLLVRQRIFEEGSIIPGISFKGNWDLPGGGAEEVSTPTVRYDYPVLEAARKAEEEVGISISLTGMPATYLTLFKGLRGYDYAGVIPLTTTAKPTKGETRWVSPQELEALAKEFISVDDGKKLEPAEAKGLVSGYGKRMHCLCLQALALSPNVIYAAEAKQMLGAIQADW